MEKQEEVEEETKKDKKNSWWCTAKLIRSIYPEIMYMSQMREEDRGCHFRSSPFFSLDLTNLFFPGSKKKQKEKNEKKHIHILGSPNDSWRNTAAKTECKKGTHMEYSLGFSYNFSKTTSKIHANIFFSLFALPEDLQFGSKQQIYSFCLSGDPYPLIWLLL